MSCTKLHKNFILNGNSFEYVEDLLTYSKTISEGVFLFFKTWFDVNNFVVVNTSGSTGKPTTIKLKKESMVNSALATGDYFKVLEKTKALLCLSPDYIAGKMMLVRALTLGWHLDVVEPSSNPLAGVKKDYDFSAMVPLQLENSLPNLHRIKKLIVGGAPVSKTLFEKLQNVTTAVFATYGMTETITHIAVKLLNASCHAVPKVFEIVSAPHYTVLPHINISKDHRNCLMINAPKISDTVIITNDLVELISTTEFKWLGRYDTIINSGGVKLIPERIEDKLSIVIDKRFFVAGVPDDVLGKKLILVIEIQDVSFKLQDFKIMITKLPSLHKYEIPKEIYTVEKFIETETKKIQRQKTLDLVFKNR